jgi:hypothetical protein
MVHDLQKARVIALSKEETKSPRLDASRTIAIASPLTKRFE